MPTKSKQRRRLIRYRLEFVLTRHGGWTELMHPHLLIIGINRRDAQRQARSALKLIGYRLSLLRMPRY